jgi:energy-coupling factor transporter ATP-binding protein EcfA2
VGEGVGAVVMKLKWLKIHQLRGVAAGTTLTFSDGFNVLLGQNGSGKTTLLKVLSCVARDDYSDMPDSSFNIEYEVETDSGSVTAAMTRAELASPLGEFTNLTSGITRDFFDGNAGGRNAMPVNFKLEIRSNKSPKPIHVSNKGKTGTDVEVLTAEGEQLLFENGYSPLRPQPLLDFSLSIKSTVHEGALAQFAEIAEDAFGWAEQRWDESLEFFEKKFKSEVVKIAFTQGRFRRMHMDMYLSGLREAIYGVMTGHAEAVRSELIEPGEPEYLNVAGDRLAALVALEEMLGAKRIVWKADRLEKSIRGDIAEVTYGNIRLEWEKQDGTIITHKHMSYGQKRLTAFLLYMSNNPQIVIADELVNGLHHTWIKECLAKIAGRQSFLTSQNPLLLDYLTLESPEQVRRSFIHCRLESKEGHELMVWENMSPEMAQSVYEASEVGIMQVNEILQRHGLW